MGGCGAAVYQTTLLSAAADGLDATPLVGFAVTDGVVAQVSSGNRLTGLAQGTTSVHLAGRPASFAKVDVSVSDAVVTAQQLMVRVVTSVAWAQQPPSWWAAATPFSASVQLVQQLRKEGDSGLVFARVVWSDGQAEDVAYAPQTGVNELNVTSRSASVALSAPLSGSNSESFWHAAVAVGAVASCGPDVWAEWLVCGVPMATGKVPLFLDVLQS